MAANQKFELRGVNHIALVCSDMARTVRFYRDVLGMPLVKTIELPGGMGQHFFFDIGNDDCLAFFWYTDAPPAHPGVASAPTLPDRGSISTAHASMNHLAFDVPLEQFEAYRASAEELYIEDPGNRRARRDMSLAYDALGDAYAQADETAKLVDVRRRYLGLAREIAEADPSDEMVERSGQDEHDPDDEPDDAPYFEVLLEEDQIDQRVAVAECPDRVEDADCPGNDQHDLAHVVGNETEGKRQADHHERDEQRVENQQRIGGEDVAIHAAILPHCGQSRPLRLRADGVKSRGSASRSQT